VDGGVTPELLFALSNAVAMIAWVALVVAPRWQWTHRLTALGVPALLAAAYVAILATRWSINADSFSTLANVAALFENPWALLAGWVHYLAFDLLIGGWISRDAMSRGIPHLFVVPCLVLTFLFGPAGWLAYQGLAVVGGRKRAASRATPA
jgi:hypothetical protein